MHQCEDTDMAQGMKKLPKPVTSEVVKERVSQRSEEGKAQFRLQVDRQTKGSYPTFEAAEKVGMAIKRQHPIVQVSVYDAVTTTTTILTIP